MNRRAIQQQERYNALTLEGVSAAEATKLYSFMVRLRKLQEELIREYPTQKIRCPVHFVIGQEAMSAALSILLEREDHLFGTHRSHGYFLAKGGCMNALVAELYGKETGVNGGKAGSQELADDSLHFHSGAILSGTLGIAVGAALGMQLNRTKQVAVACFGDGAIDEGIFWEAINYAKLCNLPMIFICENNGYSTYSPQLKRQPADNISEKVASFGFRVETIFGNDAALATRTLRELIADVRKGQGPAFVEAYTYRWRSHVGPSDDEHVGYRPPEEVEFWKHNCPIALLEEALFKEGMLSAAAKDRIVREADAEVQRALKFGQESPFPRVSDWAELNTCSASPVADKLLKDPMEVKQFDFHQPHTVPGPY